MRLTLDLEPSAAIALRRFANTLDVPLETAAELALHDWLVGHGHLEPEHELDEDTETKGSA